MPENLDARLSAFAEKLEKKSSQRVVSPREENVVLRYGVEFFSGVFTCMVIGVFVDRHCATYPWGLLSTFFLGLSVGFFNVFRVVKNRASRS